MFKVFIFPSCNEPGLEIINALAKSNKITLFGGSSEKYSEYDPSRLILKNYINCPSYYDKNFRDKLGKIIRDNHIDLVFPTVDILVAEFSKWSIEGTTFITPDSETAEMALSKSRT